MTILLDQALLIVLERYDALPLHEKQETASDITYLMEVQQEFGK